MPQFSRVLSKKATALRTYTNRFHHIIATTLIVQLCLSIGQHKLIIKTQW